MFVPSCNTDSCLHLHVLKPTCHTQAWGGKFHFQQFFVRCERTSECLGILGNRTLVSEPSRFLTLCLWDTGKGEAHTWAAERLSVGSSLCSGGSRTMALFSFCLSIPLPSLEVSFFFFFPPFVYFCHIFQFHFLYFSLFFFLFTSYAIPSPASFFDFVSENHEHCLGFCSFLAFLFRGRCGGWGQERWKPLRKLACDGFFMRVGVLCFFLLRLCEHRLHIFFAFACVLYVCVFMHVGRYQHKLLCCLYVEIRGLLPCVGPKAYSTLWDRLVTLGF